MPNSGNCAIGVMAKAPRPGFAKTRLCPPLRAEQAAALSAAFLRDITENIALAARQLREIAVQERNDRNRMDGLSGE